jgi:hypothetical protein
LIEKQSPPISPDSTKAEIGGNIASGIARMSALEGVAPAMCLGNHSGRSDVDPAVAEITVTIERTAGHGPQQEVRRIGGQPMTPK